MNRLAMVLGATLLVILASGFATNSPNSNGSPTDDYGHLVENSTFKITNISDVKEQDVADVKIVLVDDTSEFEMEMLKKVIDNNIPVIVINLSSDLFKKLDVDGAFSRSSTNLGYFVNPVDKHIECYSASMYSMENGVSELVQWANNCCYAKEKSLTSFGADVTWGTEIIERITIENS